MIQEHGELLHIVKPFEMTYKLMTTKFKLAGSISYNLPFILMTQLTCTSPCQLRVVDSKLELVCAYVCVHVL